MNMNFTTSEQVRGAIAMAEMFGKTDMIPELQRQLAMLEERERIAREEEERRHQEEDRSRQEEPQYEIVDSEFPIYDTLRKYAKYPITEEKRKCIEDTVDHLLEEGPNAEDPCLLLGKIQCGKTDTFENIIGYAFDRGIDIAVIFTKGTKALAKQTVSRCRKDYKPFEQTNKRDQRAVINIYDIMDVYTGLKRPQVDGKKLVLVCKKEATNMRHLIELFTQYSPYLADKRVLVVDDEADFASRNYQAVHLDNKVDEDGNLVAQDTEYKMAKIAEQIDEFRSIPSYCRYLQVTATPYCLYLQPNGELYLQGRLVKSFRPRFTALVPIHDAYIGGQQYYVDSKNDESMYSHLFHAVNPSCIKALKRRDRRYIKNCVESKNIHDLRYCVVAYLMGTAIRSIQKEITDNEYYKTSAVLHLDINKDNHEWQEELIKALIEQIKHFFINQEEDERFTLLINSIYADFAESNRKAREAVDENGYPVPMISVELPSLEDVLTKVRNIFEEENLIIQVVNSDEQMSNLLKEEDGQLELKAEANIFIGGSILDRGITIDHMITFFYGRDPQSFQQDTVLQHARMYGARSKEDMAVTRLYTTEKLHKVLVRMNELDEQLRQWFIEGKDQEEPNAVFVGYDKSIKPCATQKVKVSNTITLKANKFMLPIGMWTKTKTETKKIMARIDELITSSNHYIDQDRHGFFEIEKNLVVEILKLIKKTYIYDNDFFNADRKNDIDELLCAIEYCTSFSGDTLWGLHRVNRTLNRIKQNGSFQDAPHDGRSDNEPSKEIAIDRPVIMFIRQEGQKVKDELGNNIGWNGAPFYWPVFLPQRTIDPVMFAIDTARAKKVVVLDEADILEGIDPEDVLRLTSIDNLNAEFDQEGNAVEEVSATRYLTENTASSYVERGFDGNWDTAAGIELEEDTYQGIYTFNNGVFPFVLRPFKYILLRQGRNAMSNLKLLELSDPSEWQVSPNWAYDEDKNLVAIDPSTGQAKNPIKVLVTAADTLQDKNLEEIDYIEENVCQWAIRYKIVKLLREKNVNVVMSDDDDVDSENEDE